METYDFILRFNNDNYSLSAENALEIGVLANLLETLAAAVNAEGKDKIVLSEIGGNSCVLGLTTTSRIVYEQLKIVHSKIAKNDYKGLNDKQIKYAETIKGILSNNLHLQAYDREKKFDVQVEHVEIPQVPSTFNEIGAIYGVVTSQGGTIIDGATYIRVQGQNYKIKVDSFQDRALHPHYEKTRLRLILNKVICIESLKVKNATLEDFEVADDDGMDFFSELEKFRKDENLQAGAFELLQNRGVV